MITQLRFRRKRFFCQNLIDHAMLLERLVLLGLLFAIILSSAFSGMFISLKAYCSSVGYNFRKHRAFDFEKNSITYDIQNQLNKTQNRLMNVQRLFA